MLRINSGVYDSLKEYSDSWKQDSIITIFNFLEDENAHLLNDSLEKIPEKNWSYSIYPYLNNYYTFDGSDTTNINNGLISATDAYNRGEFSYIFRRYEGDITEKIKSVLYSSQFKNLIQQITNVDISTIVSTFASLYQPGHFLTTHTDVARGKIAFVYNITKNWKEDYGGNFYLLNDNWCGTKRKVVPTFNSLTLFEVSGEGRPHFVERVKDNIKEKRLCFSGWLV